jgi:hypothetical protein
VHAESASTVKPAVRRITTVQSAKRGEQGEIIYDLGALLPVESLRPVFAERNSVAAFEIAVQEKPESPWRSVSAATFHRLDRGGVELVSPPHEIGRRPARHWRLKPTVKGAVPATQPPLLEVHGRPAEIVFVTKGDGPFYLEFGDPEARPAAMPIASLIPNYERQAERNIQLAAVGSVEVVREDTAWQRYLGETSPRRVVLWAVLVLAVAVLGFIAWRLQGQMKGK